ncbi:MAG: aminotransferase [Thermoanaerobaculia bacterium]
MTHLFYPTTNLQAIEQLFIERGEGVYVYDNHGNKYLEGLAGLWCTALGYGNEELIEAAREQMSRLAYTHLFGGKTHQVAIDLADRLCSMLPIDDAKVFFGTSGSDANDTHVKLLHYYYNAIGRPEKRKIIARESSYHGVTVAAASLTGLPASHTYFDLPFDALGVLRTASPHYYRNALPGESETEFVDRLAGELEQMILAEGPETIAAFLAEPITGAAGVVVPPEGYFERIQTILDQHEILMIGDEVICGFGRTGNDFGATTVGMRPDMMTMAKALSSGYFPISASAIRSDMYEAMVPVSAEVGIFGHGFTYSGHPVGCAVALKTLEIYQRDKIFDRAAKVGEYFQNRLQELADHPLVGEVRGRGLLAAVELVADKKTKKAFEGNKIGGLAQLRCQENGLIVRALPGNSVALCPPLIITEAQVDELVEKLGHALDAMMADVDTS